MKLLIKKKRQKDLRPKYKLSYKFFFLKKKIRKSFRLRYKLFLKKKKIKIRLTPFRPKYKRFSYKPFLKNNLLKQKQFKFPQLYENIFLYKNNKFNFFEFNKLESIRHPAKYKIPRLKKKMASCKPILNFNRLFLNFKLNFFILQNFNKIKLKQQFSQNNNFYTVGRILKQTKNYTNILLSVFGILFNIQTRNLQSTIDKLMRNKYVFFQIRRKKNKKKNEKKQLKINKYFKLEQGRRLLDKYHYKLLHFKLLSIKNNLAIFSRRDYLKLMKKNNKIIKLKLFKERKIFSFLMKQYLFYSKKKKKTIPSYMYKKKKRIKKE